MIVLDFKVCAKVCADENGRLGVARKLLKNMVLGRQGITSSDFV